MCVHKKWAKRCPLSAHFSIGIFIIFLNFQRMMTRFLLHNLTLTVEKETGYIGVWGQRSLNYLKPHRKVSYYNLPTSGKLHSHLADTEKQAQQLFLRLVKELAEKENVTEDLKTADMILWVQKMNNIRNRATEVVNSELIFVWENKILSVFNLHRTSYYLLIIFQLSK